ncbi:universal stress protein [Marivita sp. XM-24bin2]|uniref:universal stress protein n=1 Tax=unclassified Marivita TaxID=2632480 RepID=UPI000D798372|nr:universal stress protein [Marivita sp. XM-24bin2]MCR9110482.1 universal stress protein [Paracoccaceae bacterium]PWL35260.1 MAG: universal stress protein UspA [Marivita sp. XM-24bin2]
MFNRIMVPVDLAHAESLDRALKCAADLAGQHGAEIVYVGVTAQTPGAIAHTPAEFKGKLADFAKEQSEQYGVSVTSHVIESHDPAAEMDKDLLKAVRETGADLVVMQSHKPGLTDYLFEGHGPYLAQHAEASVMLVRD